MEIELTVPAEVGVMTLPGVAFFPQALMPLHIFEPRYRQMLADALDSHRLFALAGLDGGAQQRGAFEPSHRVATLGIVRACQEAGDGTSNLLLQGITRVRIEAILGEDPYRRARVRALQSITAEHEAEEINRLRAHVSRLLTTKLRLSGETPTQFNQFLRTVDDPDVFTDLAAFNLCEDAALKQRLLETLSVRERLALFDARLRIDVQTLKLRRRLQGDLPDDDVGNN
jgi:Lon protease-like protein